MWQEWLRPKPSQKTNTNSQDDFHIRAQSPLEQLQGWSEISEPTRRLMSVIDLVNGIATKVIDPDTVFGNIGGIGSIKAGAGLGRVGLKKVLISQQTSGIKLAPSLLDLIRRSSSSMQSQYLGKAGFIDNLGNLMDIGNKTHEAYLIAQNMLKPSRPGYSGLAATLADTKLIRFRDLGNSFALEIAERPTLEQMASIRELVTTGKPISADIWSPKLGQLHAAQEGEIGSLWEKLKAAW